MYDMLADQISYDGDDEMDHDRYRGGRIIRKKMNNSQEQWDGARSVPLSMATLEDDDGDDVVVLNDILKIVIVGGATTVDKQELTRRLTSSQTKNTTASSSRKQTTNSTLKGVDVHSWTPVNDQNTKFTIWTVLGNNAGMTDPPPHNTNIATQSAATQSDVVISDRSLYLLVWDLAVNNEGTYRREAMDDSTSSSSDSDDSSEDDDDDDDDENDYLQQVIHSQADRNLQKDILHRVLSWVETIAQRNSSSHSAILPVALVPSRMSPEEIQRRCNVWIDWLQQCQRRLERRKYYCCKVPKILSGAESLIPCVSLMLDTTTTTTKNCNNHDVGIDFLQETIVGIANNNVDHPSVFFDHLGTPVPKGTVQVLETSRRLQKTNHKRVSLDLFMSALVPPPSNKENLLSVHQVVEALEFLSSIGELFFFGNTTSDENVDTSNVLTQFIDFQ